MNKVEICIILPDVIMDSIYMMMISNSYHKIFGQFKFHPLILKMIFRKLL